jgi:hypothetical protein
MELDRLIDKLQTERTKLDQIIQSLEQIHAATAANPPRLEKRRGRKFMGEVERRQVSERITRYWANRRARMMAQESSESPRQV